MKEEWMPIESNISFADGSLRSFNFEQKNRILNIFLECWNEKIAKITFEEVLYFQYKLGDFISGIYHVLSESSILNESLIREYDKIPEEYSHKLILIKDIDDFSVAEIVCNKFSISLEESK